MARMSRKRRLARLTRPIRYRLLTPILEALRATLAFLPHGLALTLGRWTGRVAWLACGGVRRLAQRQLAQSGVGAHDAGRRRITRRMFEALGMNALEWLHATGWTDQQVRRNVVFERPDQIQSLLDSGHGLLIITAHMGNWELLPRAFRLNFGHPVSLVMAGLRDRRLTQWIVRLREIGGNRVITTEEGALAPMRVLRRGGALGILADQDTTRGRGLFVDFFGRPAYTPAGPAHLLQRSDIALLPLIIHRDPLRPYRHVIHSGTLIQADPQAPEEKVIRRITQAYTRQIEDQIRAWPEQWAWLHDRWRRQPGQRIRVRATGRRSMAN